MRFVLAGIIHLLLISSALAGVIGKVDSIGFEAQIRSGCWVPLLVQITSDAAMAEEYTLQVVQNDLDGDEVVYTTPRKTINPGTQGFWLYFKPQAVDGGLPNAKNAGNSSELARKLRVYVASADGQKRLVQVSVAGKMPDILDEVDAKAEKLIVCVGRRVNSIEFDKDAVYGVGETVKFAPTDPRRLPDNAIGYDAVDAIVWTDAEVDRLEPAQFRALRQWVQGGGKLVVLQNAEAGRMEKLADFLPVRVGKIEEWTLREPLKSILHPPNQPRLRDRSVPNGREIDPFRNTFGPFRMARSEALPDAVVDTWIGWPNGTQTPYIARRLYGMGTVIWVAQDVSDASIRDVSWGWPNFWREVFDWPLTENRLQGLVLPELYRIDQSPQLLKSFVEAYRPAGTKDIGAAFFSQLNLSSKTAALISLAFLFFIGYWLIAGPGAFLLLAAKKRTQMSWFVFGAIAVVATLLTVVVAQLVLRGSAQIRHVSMVRARADTADSARVWSRFGIYLPQDRPDTEIALNERDVNAPGIITPLSTSPRYADKSNPRDSRYDITIANEDAGEKVVAHIPFRSTLKKLEAQWSGAPAGRVSGSARLTGRPMVESLSGLLTNNTGRDLSHALLVYSAPDTTEHGAPTDYVLYMRLWQKGASIDLAKALFNADQKTDTKPLTLDGEKNALGTLKDAAAYFHRNVRSGMMSDSKFDDSEISYRSSFPIASLYERLAPMKNSTDRVLGNMDRSDLFRRGIRSWDISSAVAGGALVVLGQSNNDTVPLPLTVEGYAPEGTGITFWQFIVPLDRTAVNKPPSTQPTTDRTENN